MADAVNERDSPPPTKKRAVCWKTVEKWIKENDRSLNTTVWLKFDSDSHDHVDTLSCKVCSQFKDKLIGMRNYHPAFVEGTSNVRSSSFKDHDDKHAYTFCMGTGGIGRSTFRTNLALYWQSDSTSEKVIFSPEHTTASLTSLLRKSMYQ